MQADIPFQLLFLKRCMSRSAPKLGKIQSEHMVSPRLQAYAAGRENRVFSRLVRRFLRRQSVPSCREAAQRPPPFPSLELLPSFRPQPMIRHPEAIEVCRPGDPAFPHSIPAAPRLAARHYLFIKSILGVGLSPVGL